MTITPGKQRRPIAAEQSGPAAFLELFADNTAAGGQPNLELETAGSPVQAIVSHLRLNFAPSPRMVFETEKLPDAYRFRIVRQPNEQTV